MLLFLFGEEFPKIYHDHEEVLREIAQGASIDEAVTHYKEKLKNKLKRAGLREQEADTSAELLKKDLLSYYAYIYAPLAIHSGEKPQDMMRNMARFLLQYTKHMKNLESRSDELLSRIMEGKSDEALKEAEESIRKVLHEAHREGLPLFPLLAHSLRHVVYDALREALPADKASKRLGEMRERLIRYILDLYSD